MIVIIEGVAMPPINGKRDVRRFAYTQEEPQDASIRGESLRDCNHCQNIINRITSEGSGIENGTPPSEGDVLRMYQVAIQVFNSHRNKASYRASYKRGDYCPLEVIREMMDIYKQIKHILRNSRKEYEAEKLNKKGV